MANINEEDGIAGSVDVQQLLKSVSTISPKLAARIRKADLDNDGHLSMEELVEVMRSEQQAIGDRKLLRNILIALAIAVLVLIATLCGTVYAIVKLTQEVNDQDGLLVSSSSGDVMSTGLAQESLNATQLYRYQDPAILRNIEGVLVPTQQGVTMYRVSKITAVPNISATIYTIDGSTLEVDDSGVYVVDERDPRETDQPSQGRRSLSQLVNPGGFNVQFLADSGSTRSATVTSCYFPVKDENKCLPTIDRRACVDGQIYYYDGILNAKFLTLEECCQYKGDGYSRCMQVSIRCSQWYSQCSD